MRRPGGHKRGTSPRLIITGFLLAGLVFAAPAEAGEKLHIRLVLAHNDNEVVSKGLQDVKKTLVSNLPYTGFELLDQKKLSLPGGGKVELRHSIKLTASGTQDSLRVRVRHKRKPFVNTTLRLADGKPVILGGIPSRPSRKGRVLVVIVAR